MANTEVKGPNVRQLAKDEMIVAAGESSQDLYYINSGKLLVFVNNGTQITPLAELDAGEYFGEMSFFDKSIKRSAHVIAVEETTLVKLSIENFEEKFPKWLQTIAVSMVQKLKNSSEKLRQKGIRRKNVKSIKPLSIDEQRHYYKALQDYITEHSLDLE